MKKDNPFTLTFGRQPNKYINRFENTSDIVDTFDSENPVCQTYLIEGVRGSGKTVLMTRAAKELEETGSWIVIDLNPTQDLLVDFANRLVAAVKMFPNIFDKGFSVSFAGFGLGLNGEEKNNDPVGVIENILTHLKKKKKRILKV